MKKMKKLFILLIISCLLCGCGSPENTPESSSHKEITINLPTDNSVNGYRTESVQSSSSSKDMPDKIPVTDTKTETESSQNKSYLYIGNSNSKIFHKSDCTSAAKMKDSNKVSFSSREDAVNSGYSPCGRCSP